MKNNYKEICDILRADNRFVSSEGSLLKNKIVECANKMDSGLISLLYKNEFTKNMFFTNVDEIAVFDKVKFGWVIESEDFLPNSYTRFKNKILLTDSVGNSIKKTNDIVLEFPHKDCFVLGGQTKEEENRDEKMLNEILNKLDIDTLLSPKVFTNATLYSKNGVEKIDKYNGENLIIKGNNLIVLSSLLTKFAGKVKVIYIDVPFNTKNDSFRYNDSFSRSTWLTFMKNRLEIAYKLLADDGSIFIHCDEHQSHYLKVLCDEIFNEENFMNEIIWRYRTYVGQVKEYFPKKHDTIFWYKNKIRPKFKKENVGNFEDTPDYKRWKDFYNDKGQILYGNHPTTDSRFTAYLNKYIKQYGTPNIIDVIYENKGYIVDDVWEDIIALDAKNKSERIELFSGSGQKPEALIERIINCVSEENDLILDFFMGSGTTCAVAHKMKRRYIGIEQMDYIQDVSVERMKNVINGEQGGISQSIGWSGGGSFIYFELLENSKVYINKIMTATEEELFDLYNYLRTSDFILYRVDIDKMDKIKDAFDDLSVDEKRKFLVSIIDKNTLYINYSDIDDSRYDLLEEDKKFTRSFYEEDVK